MFIETHLLLSLFNTFFLSKVWARTGGSQVPSTTPPSPLFCLFPLIHYEGLKDLPMPCMVVTFLGSVPEMKLRELEYFILFIFGFLLYLS